MTFRALRRSLLPAAAATLLAVSAAGCASTSSSGSEAEQTTIQTNAGLIDLPELADALGYLDGLTLERVGDVQGGPESLRAVATDQVDHGDRFPVA